MKRLLNLALISALIVMNTVFVAANPYSHFTDMGFKVLASDNRQLMLSYKPIVTKIDTIITSDGTMTLLPNIKGGTLAAEQAGAPAKIVVRVPVAVPGDKKFTLLDLSVVSKKVISGRMSPIPSFDLKNDVWTEVFDVDKNRYFENRELSAGGLMYSGISLDVHIAELSITAASFNPLNQSIEIPEEVLITIIFDGNTDLGHSDSETPFTRPVLNPEQAFSWKIASDNKSFGFGKKILDKQLELSSGNWIKVAVPKEGLYKIDASKISSLGFNIPKDQIGTIKLFGNGGRELSEIVDDAAKNDMNEQAIIVNTNGSGDFESIVFYGAPTQGFIFNGESFVSWYNHYSDMNYYLLTWGGDQGKRASAENNSELPVENTPLKYTEKILYKEELTNALVGGSGRVWFGGSIFPRAFNNTLHNLDRTQDIYYNFSFAHRSSGNGKFTVSESGNKIGDVVIPLTSDTKYLDARERYVEAVVSPDKIQGDNRSLINITYENPYIAGSTPFFNWYEIHFSRSFIPVDNEIGFWTDATMTGTSEFSINGFSGVPICFDVTDPGNPMLVRNEAVTGGMFVFKYDIDSIPKRFYAASAFEIPELSITTFANLRTTPKETELILITSPALMTSAEEYKSFRADRNIEIVSVTDIYNEFNGGVKDPTAIRDYIAFVVNNREMKPKYVLLWGDGHYDFKNIQTNAPNHIPTYQSHEYSDSYEATRSYSTDDYFGWIAGNDRYMDIVISRVPISDNNEGSLFIDKLKFYEQFSSLDNWRTSMMMIADDSPTSRGSGDGSTHTRQSETLSNLVVPDYMVNRKIYLPEYPSENIPNGRRKPRVTEDILSFVNNNGCLTMNWVGHGNPRVWAHEEIFDRDKTISQFKNLDKLFFNTAATCDFARFDMPETESGAEALLLAPNGGSIGEFSSTRVVYSYDNAQINETFHRELFTRDASTGEYKNIGDVMFAVKQLRANSNDIKYNLFGDPLLQLLIPYYIVRVETINSQSVINPLDTAELKAMAKVDVVASVISPVDSSVVNDFNGFCNVSLLDADYSIIAVDVDGTKHSIEKYGGALNRGSFPVVNGRIEASFYLPEDISFQAEPGRLYIYSSTEDRRTANGVNRQFKIVGVDSVDFEVGKPQLSVFLDSVTFKPGDIVASPPMLIVNVFDEYGVNTSGSGIGHRLEAWIDDSPNSIDLTDRTNISPDDPKVIEARQVLSDLSPGIHKVKVRAWNVFNKYSVEETYFRILSGDEGAMIWDVNPYPNPFSDDVILRFRHNLSLPFDAQLSVYNMEGRLVKRINTLISSVHTSEIEWDGTDFNGNMASQGLYMLQVEISTYKGNAKASAGAAFVR